MFGISPTSIYLPWILRGHFQMGSVNCSACPHAAWASMRSLLSWRLPWKGCCCCCRCPLGDDINLPGCNLQHEPGPKKDCHFRARSFLQWHLSMCWWQYSPLVEGKCSSFWQLWLLLITIWQTHAPDFPVLARIARDILALLGVSISVEQLFSSSKNTLSDSVLLDYWIRVEDSCYEGMVECNIFSTIHICAYLPRPSGLIGTVT